MSDSASSFDLPLSHREELQALKSLITTLQQYLKGRRRPNDHELRKLQESGEKLLVGLEDSSHATLYCANFIVTMMTFLPESRTYFNGSRIRSVLQALIDNVEYIDNSDTHSAVELLWKSIVQVDLTLRFVEYTSDRFKCMFPHLLINAFNYLRHTSSPALYNLLNAVGVKCLLKLAEYPTNEATHESLSIILMQLVEPYSNYSKLVAQGVLKTCGYDITGAIIQLLSPVLVRGGPKKNDHSICHFVYNAIYELLKIDHALVIGLINNTELCLNTGRLDRCTGIEFLASVFSGENIPGMCNPSQFFPHLWRTFSVHCQTPLTSKAEVMLIARFSTNFLVHQPDLADTWCAVLRSRLLNSNDSECIRALTQSIANYFLHDFPSSHAIRSTEIDTLIKDLLRIWGPHELPTRYRIIFVQQLASVYEKIVNGGLNTSNWKRASAVLEYIYFVCDLFDPLSEDWCLLRNVFLNHLVPWDLDSNERVKRFLLLFIITEPKHHLVLHQLFYRTIKVRGCVRSFLQCRPLNWGQLVQYSYHLNMYLVHGHMSVPCIRKHILQVACTKQIVRELLTKVLDFNVTCTASKEACDDLKQLFVTPVKRESEIIDSFLFYIAEPTFDASFFQVLVKEVNSHLLEDGDSFGNSTSALLALDELLYVRPELGFTIEFVKQLKGWIENATDGELIRLMLGCFIRMHRHLKLELWNPQYTQHELIPFWLQIVESGKREETKRAIQCLALHLQISSDTAFEKVLKILDNQLKDADNWELYEHGVSALGHVAKVSFTLSPAARKETNRLAMARVLENMYEHQEDWTKPTTHNPECQWIPWRDLNIGIRIQVQSVRTLGRCMRYISQKEEAKLVLRRFENAFKVDYPTECSKIDWDWIRLESAAAALNIWERKDVCIGTQLFIMLAHLLTDDSVMVRKLLAEKLRRGLTPQKVWVGKKGKSKGSLPSYALGLLAVLGLNDERENFDQSFDLSHEDDVVIDVLQSRHNQICVLACSLLGEGNRFTQVCEMVPALLPEYALANAVPILAEHSALNLSQKSGPYNFDSFELEEDAIVKAWKCFSFLSQRMGVPLKAVPGASKSFVMQMAKKARETIKPTDDEVKFKKHLILCDLLLLVAEHHSVWGSEQIQLNPPVKLSKSFFNSEPLEDRRCKVGNLISGNMAAKLLSSRTITEVESTYNSSENMNTEKESEGEEELSEGEEELAEGDSSTSGKLSWDSLSQIRSIGAVRGENQVETKSKASSSSTFNSTMASPSIPPIASSTPKVQPSTSFQSKRTLDDEKFKKPHRKFTKK